MSTQLLLFGRKQNSLFAAILLCFFSITLGAQSSETARLPVFTPTDLRPIAKGKFLDAAPHWTPAFGVQPSAVPTKVLDLKSGKWETHGPGWVLADGSANVSETPASEPSYLVSPTFRVPEGRQLFRFNEKYSLESNRDFGSVWIKAEDEISWRRVHTLTGVADWRYTYLNLSPYAGKSIRVAFMLSADASVAGSGWVIGDVAVVQPHHAGPTIPSKSAKPLGKMLENLNLILTSRETNTFPRISATVRAENIPDLTKSNFTVTENDGLQNFNIVLPQGGVARPADIVFIVDNSGSMSPFQNAISNTINDFVTELFDSGINAALGLTRFGQGAGNGSPIVEGNGTLYTDPDVYLNSIFTRNTSSGGNEPGLDAINVSISNFNFRPNSQKIFILLTNEDHDGFTEPGDVLPNLQSNAITLFSLIDPSFGTSQFDYGDLASNSGGQQFDIDDVGNPSTLEPIIEAIEDNIATNDAYIISYTTDNQALDGIERTVNIIANRGTETDTVSFKYTPGAAPIIDLTASTVALIGSPQPVGVPVTIQATITDLSAPFVQSASLLYRTTGQPIYTAVPLINVSGDLYEAEIPAGIMQMPGVDFYLTATDGISTTSDRTNSPAENPYQIAVNPNVAPVITSTPVVSLPAGQDLVVSAEIVDNTNTVAAASLFYRNLGEPLFKEVPCLNTGGDTYQATVAANLITGTSVEYFIRATDDFGINAYFGTPDDPIRVEIISEGRVPSVLTLDPATATVTAGVEICIVGTVLDQFGAPLAGIEVFTEVDGVLVGSGITDAAGEVEYCFTPAQSGQVTIVCYYQGGQRVTAEVTVTEPTGPSTTTFTFIDADTDLDLFDLEDGDSIAVEDLPESLTIRANYLANSIGSAVFQLSGPIQHSQTESVPAYSLFGNTRDDYNGRMFPPGAYKLQVTPYSGASGTGVAGATIAVNFTIIPALPTTFTFVDADTDLDLFDLMDGDSISEEDLPQSATIRANFPPNSIGTAVFELSGPIRHTQLEDVAAYSLFGNTRDDYNGRMFPPGEYTLRVTTYSGLLANGVNGATTEVNFTIVPAPPTTFTFVDADTNLDLFDLEDGDSIAVEDLPESLSIRANIPPNSIGTAVFELSGPIQHTQLEDVADYALFGNTRDNYNGRMFPPGAYTLQVTTYSGLRATGAALDTIGVNFTIVPAAPTSFTFVDADTNVDLFDLEDGDSIAAGDLPQSVSIRANFPPNGIGTAVFELSGPILHTQLEDVADYALFGNTRDNYNGRMFPPGAYTLQVTTYSGLRAKGVAGATVEIQFTVLEGGASTVAKQSIYPMPFRGQFTVENVDGTPIKEVHVFDQNGTPIRANVQTGKRGATVILPEGRRQSMMIVRTVSENGSVKSTLIQRMQ